MGPTSSTDPSAGPRADVTAPNPTETHRYDGAARARLLEVARAAIERGLDGSPGWVPSLSGEPRILTQARGCFVTLHRHGELRGCVGSLAARGPLVQEVARSAYNAAFRDPRFVPLSRAELEGLDIHISVLSEAKPMAFSSEEDLVEQLRPGVDGLILEEGPRLGTFLPDVWEKVPDRRDFLQQLKRKAGLPTSYWSPTVRVLRYTTEGF